MKQHQFIFDSGNWIGEGNITISVLAEELPFKTTWAVESKDLSGKVSCMQNIEISGIQEGLVNELTFYSFGANSFSVDMENENVGRIVGVGFYDEQRISWEFRNNDKDFEGYESYALQPDGSYHMRGEYVTVDKIRTVLESKIRPRVNSIGSLDESQDEEGLF